MSDVSYERWFGTAGKEPAPATVADLVRRLRQQSTEEQNRIIVAQVDDTVAEAHKLFRNYDMHHLPVVSGAKVVGIVSSTDLLEFFSKSQQEEPSKARLGDIMTPNPQTMSKETSIRELVKTLARSRFRCLPVVDSDGDLWALLTTRDLIRFLELNFDEAPESKR